jgi:hypothetical protein
VGSTASCSDVACYVGNEICEFIPFVAFVREPPSRRNPLGKIIGRRTSAFSIERCARSSFFCLCGGFRKIYTVGRKELTTLAFVCFLLHQEKTAGYLSMKDVGERIRSWTLLSRGTFQPARPFPSPPPSRVDYRRNVRARAHRWMH